MIVQEAAVAEKVVFAPGTGKVKNKLFVEVQEQTLLALRFYEDKLYCLCDEKGGSRLQHPLSPRVRDWYLSPLKIGELVKLPEQAKQEDEKKPKGKSSRKETSNV